MTSPKISSKRGLVKMIVIIVIALIILGYFGFNLREIISSPTVHDNLAYAWNLAVNIWDNYLKGPVLYLWHIFINLIWEPAMDVLNRMKDGGAPILEGQTPKLPQLP